MRNLATETLLWLDNTETSDITGTHRCRLADNARDAVWAMHLMTSWVESDGGRGVEIDRVGKYWTVCLTDHDGATTKYIGRGMSLGEAAHNLPQSAITRLAEAPHDA